MGHGTYTFAKMIEIAALTGFGVAMLALMVLLAGWTRAGRHAAEAALAARETRCAAAGCTHAHPARSQDIDAPDDDDATINWLTCLSSDTPAQWQGIDAELSRVLAWADRVLAG